jgi:hypothetical protein
LGGEPKYNRADIVEKSGIPLERVIALWIGMGFPVHTDTDALVYTDADPQGDDPLERNPGLLDDVGAVVLGLAAQ